LRLLWLRRTPLIDVVTIDAETEKVRGNKSGLLGLETDIADDDAVGRGDEPSLPAAFADENRGADGKNARNVIKTHEVLPFS